MNRNLESQLLSRVLRDFGGLPWLRLFRRNVGYYYLPDLRTRIKIGVEGQCDLYGFAVALDPSAPAITLEIELKSPTGSLSKEQRDWRDTCLRLGVLWILARSTDDVRDGLSARGYGERFRPTP